MVALVIAAGWACTALSGESSSSYVATAEGEPVAVPTPATMAAAVVVTAPGAAVLAAAVPATRAELGAVVVVERSWVIELELEPAELEVDGAVVVTVRAWVIESGPLSAV